MKPAEVAATALSAATNTTEAVRNSTALESIWISSISKEGGIPVVRFTGRAEQLYILQATERINTTNWINVSTNRASASGTGELRDEQPGNFPMRFYRVATP